MSQSVGSTSVFLLDLCVKAWFQVSMSSLICDTSLYSSKYFERFEMFDHYLFSGIGYISNKLANFSAARISGLATVWSQTRVTELESSSHIPEVY